MFIFRQHLSRVKNLSPVTDYSFIGVDRFRDRFEISHGEEVEEYETSYNELNKKLVDHFAFKEMCLNFFFVNIVIIKSVNRSLNLDYRIIFFSKFNSYVDYKLVYHFENIY